MNETRQSSPQAWDRQNALTWPRAFTSKFIEPGVIHYEQFGTELLNKPTLDAFIQSFVGKPVIIQHSKVTAADFLGKAVGYISRVWYEPADGWYHCEGIITDDVAKTLIEEGWSVSCSYRVLSTAAGGKYHNLDYARELTSFEGEHLALVENPRYEEATIRLNEKPNKTMNVFKVLFKKIAGEDRDNAAPKEIDAEKAVVSVNGKDHSLKDLVAKYKEDQASRANSITADALVEIDGVQVPVSELLRVNGIAAEAKKETPRENALVEDKGGRIGLVAKKKKRENEEEGDEDESDEDRKNSAASFQKLRSAAGNVHIDSAGAVQFSADTLADRCARGREMFGPIKK